MSAGKLSIVDTTPVVDESSELLKTHKVVSEAEWLEARKELLAKEKEFTKLRDQMTAARMELPWVKVNKQYLFDGPDGKDSRPDLFGGNSQLIVYHFMFGPEWEEGCPGCSFLVDHLPGVLLHIEHHDVSLVVVSRAPLAKLEAYKQRMGWKFNWVSSFGTDFNFDYHVSATEAELAKGKMIYNFGETKANDEMPGVSVFYKDENGAVFHTYSSFERGPDALIGSYHYLELTPKGRNEHGPNGNLGDWVRRHDKY